jgi:predicted DNA-binding transcriptional regulator YafY
MNLDFTDPQELALASFTAQMGELSRARAMKAYYLNHRGERSERTFLPLLMKWKTCQCHGDKPTWVVIAWCYDRQAIRNFALDQFTTPWMPA